LEKEKPRRISVQNNWKGTTAMTDYDDAGARHTEKERGER
jgi:hypothetical protein|tara:strand:- start:130 stop:249 length:120 start_codon:yes stop_codon:yes gene_type:complete